MLITTCLLNQAQCSFARREIMTGSISKIAIVECLECGHKILLHESAQIGHIVTCPECLEQFEVCWLDPLEIDWADIDDKEDEFEDWV
jgi:lysine biosynthesis protein LysW